MDNNHTNDYLSCQECLRESCDSCPLTEDLLDIEEIKDDEYLERIKKEVNVYEQALIVDNDQQTY